jgi:hypothetical protein
MDNDASLLKVHSFYMLEKRPFKDFLGESDLLKMKQGGIHEDLKKVPSCQQIQRTLQDLIEEGRVVSAILPVHDYCDIMIDYYILTSVEARNGLICECKAIHGQADTAKFGSDVFGEIGFYGLQPKTIPPLLLSVQLLMERTHPDKSEGYEEQFKQMEECIAWINDGIPLPTDKPHSRVVTDNAFIW